MTVEAEGEDWIKLVCRHCGRAKMELRKPYVPPTAVTQECECPKCSISSWCEVKWFDTAGNRVMEATNVKR